MDTENCCVGKALKEECDKTFYCRVKGRILISSIADPDIELLTQRTGHIFDSNNEICLHHEKVYISKYEALQKYYFDPYKSHKKKITKGLCKVDMKTTTKLNMKPGQKLCTNCFKKVTSEQASDKSEDGEDNEDQEEEFSCTDLDKSVLNENASLLGISPLKSVGKRDSLGYGKQKIKKFKQKLTCLVAASYNLEKEEISSDVDTECTKCIDLDRLVKAMKEKLAVSSKEEKVQILTLSPESWSISKICNEFSVSEHLVRKARKLKHEKGILGAKKGQPVKDDVKEKVWEIYESEEFTRICPGKKDYVSVYINGVKIHKQKRLILVQLKELYLEYKIGFSKFCELRPKWCITVNSSGTHSVCVCSYHQNTKLMCAALPNGHSVSYKNLMEVCVCDTKSRNCMFHLCSHCPSKSNLSEHLKTLFEKNDFDLDDKITYKQWVSTDRTTLITFQSDVSEFIEALTEKLYELCHHHFIKEAQSSFLTETKTNLDDQTCLILMDFAENYSFLIQDAIQGFY